MWPWIVHTLYVLFEADATLLRLHDIDVKKIWWILHCIYIVWTFPLQHPWFPLRECFIEHLCNVGTRLWFDVELSALLRRRESTFAMSTLHQICQYNINLTLWVELWLVHQHYSNTVITLWVKLTIQRWSKVGEAL